MSERKRTRPAVNRPPRQRMLDGFYRAFEDRFRGSRKIIRQRLEVYQPFIEPIKLLEEQPSAVDLGCGRGEWLELLRDSGFEAQGIDLDERMLSACHERGLAATNGDAIEFLENLPDCSRNIISGFHIAEHLPFTRLQILVYEALRVLRPGGLLILETPNPENIKVSSLSFHLDPTHLSPLPPALLAFLPEYMGFQRTKIIRLQENPALLGPNKASLEQVLTGVSPDYAIISQKALDDVNSQLFAEVFNRAFGLDDEILINRFDQNFLDQTQQVSELRKQTLELQAEQRYILAALNERQLTGISQDCADIFRKTLESETLIDRFDQKLIDQSRQVSELREYTGRVLEEHRYILAALNERFAEQQYAAASSEARIAEIYASTSWRLTKPLRLFGEAGRSFVSGAWAWLTFKPRSRPRRMARRGIAALTNSVQSGDLRSRVRQIVRRILLLGLRFSRDYPMVRATAKYALKFAPAHMRKRLMDFALAQALAPTPASAQGPQPPAPQAQAIYSRLRGMAPSPDFFTDKL